MSPDGKPPADVCPPASRPAISTTEKFYPPTVVASIVTALLLGAREDGTPYSCFKEQLEETRDMARKSGDREHQDLADLLTTVLNFHETGNEDLFLNAHMGVKLLLKALAATTRWSPCLFVTRENVLEIAKLPKH